MSRQKGNLAEDKACEYLNSQGFEIVDRNFYSRFGEIDIIAIKNDILHFIEVKSAQSYEVAIENITPSKLSKFISTVNVYLKKFNITSHYEIDAIVITPNSECELIENITI